MVALAVCWSLCVVVFVVCCLFGARCGLLGVCRVLCVVVVFCLLNAVRCLLFVVSSLICVVMCRILFLVYCLFGVDGSCWVVGWL